MSARPPLPELKPNAKIYFLGIGGTGMAAAAGLMKEAGFAISGSDGPLYPPMSTMLEDLKIPRFVGYDANNVIQTKPDCVVVANALSRGNVEIEYTVESGIPYTSFPELLGELILKKQNSIVVSGTHGKTTTTAAISHVLEMLGLKPGFLIGGMPHDFPLSFRLGAGKYFVIEGDEYDTAFFDKNSKFHHYQPKHLILNNIEFDHADIFKSLEDIYRQFGNLLDRVPDPKNIIANVDDAGVVELLKRKNLTNKVTRVATLGKTSDADVIVESGKVGEGANWIGLLKAKQSGSFSFTTKLSGTHNIANLAMVFALSERLLGKELPLEKAQQAFGSFRGVKRRLELLHEGKGVSIYEDFAHHPTAVRLVIQGFREAHPKSRIIVAFEPRSATQRRNVFSEQFAEALKLADMVLIGECPVDKRIAENERMDTQALAQAVGPRARAFATNDSLVDELKSVMKAGDAIIFMSSGAFSGSQHKFVASLK